jgi:hypothetical protein
MGKSVLEHQKVSARLLGWAGFVLLVSQCGPPEPRTVPCEDEPRQLPAAFSEFLLEDGRAPELLARVFEDPFDSRPRSEIAAIYEKQKGYGSLVSLFDSTAEYLVNRKLPTSKRIEAVDRIPCSVYSGPVDEARARAGAGGAIADRIGDARRNGEPSFAEAAHMAESAIQEYGSHCRLLAEWSFSTLNYYMRSPQCRDPIREELAIRILLTLAETGIAPAGHEGSAAINFFLSDYFLARGDEVTAFFAAIVAKDRLLSGSATGFWDRGAFSNAVEERITQLEPLVESRSLESRQ